MLAPGSHDSAMRSNLAHPFVRFGVHLELDLSADTTTWPAVELQPEAIYEARFWAAERAFGQS